MSLADCARIEARNLGCVLAEIEKENDAGWVSGGGDQSTITAGQLSGPRDPQPDDMAMGLDHNDWWNRW